MVIQEGRITSLHGVFLPPKKKKVFTRHITFRFVIEGAVPSKKNMIWADHNLFMLKKKLLSFKVVKDLVHWLTDTTDGRKPPLQAFIRNSKKYNDWVEAQRPVISTQAQAEMKRYAKHGLIYPLTNVSVKVYHYWSTNQERDLTNKLDTLNDLFVACGIVLDDRWQTIGKIESDCECY